MIAPRAVVIGLIGGAEVGAVAGACLPPDPLGYGHLVGMVIGVSAGLPISLISAYAAAKDIVASSPPHRTAVLAFAGPARGGSAVLSIILALLSIFPVGPIYALVLAGYGLLIVTPLAALIARATAPWCLAEAVPRIAPARRSLVAVAFAVPVAIAIGAPFGWQSLP